MYKLDFSLSVFHKSENQQIFCQNTYPLALPFDTDSHQYIT